MRNAKLLVAALAVAGAAYLVIDRPSPTPAAPAPVAHPAPRAAPSGEVAALRAEVAQVRAALPRTAPDAPALDDPQPAPPEAAAPDPARLDELVDTEAYDSSWSGDTERAIAAVIETDAAGSELIDVTCRTSLCRVVVKHADEPTQLAFLGRVLPSPAFHAAGFAQRFTDPDDPSDVRTVVFLARGDQPLPL